MSCEQRVCPPTASAFGDPSSEIVNEVVPLAHRFDDSICTAISEQSLQTMGSAAEINLVLINFLNIPFAATGGIFALALRGMRFSISAAVAS